MIITVQKEREKPEEIKEACDKFGIKHWLIHMDGAKEGYLNDKHVYPRIRKETNELFDYLVYNEEKCLLHCAAGCHRTGCVTYTLLRLSGLAPEEAYLSLRGMRKITFEEVGEFRLQIAEQRLVGTSLEVIQPLVIDPEEENEEE